MMPVRYLELLCSPGDALSSTGCSALP